MRLVIHTSDVCMITGRSQKYAQKLLKEIRTRYSIPKEHYVTVKIFCQHTGLNEEDVQKTLK